MKIYKYASLGALMAGTFVATSVATPAEAAVVLCTGANCVKTDSNVLVNSGSGPVLTGTYNDADVEVTFTTTTSGETLVANGNGQASVGALDNLLNQLTFTLQSGFGFTSALFNLAPVSGNAANEAVSVFVNYLNADGSTGQVAQTVSTNGQNFIGLTGTNGEVFTSAGFTANPTNFGVGEFQQLRLGGVAAFGAVPEPAAWMMMLVGMFGVGFSMRRKNKTGARVRFA